MAFCDRWARAILGISSIGVWLLLTGGSLANPKKLVPEADSAPAAAIQESKNSLGMVFVLVRSGNFLMGAPDSDKNCPPYERPQHRVRIKKPFLLGKFEVTRGQFRKFVDATAFKTYSETNGQGARGLVRQVNGEDFGFGPLFSWRNTGFDQTDQHPVVNVTWSDAQQFCEWLSHKEGKKYRLPTEAEWEWACRAGTIERFYLGDEHRTLDGKVNLADASLFARFPSIPCVKSDDRFPFTAPVGQFSANPFGLHDMHGNVREWCSDWFDDDTKYYAKSPINDPRGPVTGSYGVTRGGGWQNRPAACRSASRIWHSRDYPQVDLGFRVVCEQPDD